MFRCTQLKKKTTQPLCVLCLSLSHRYIAFSEMNVAYKCGICAAEVEEDDNALQCENDCMMWFHISCVNITEEQYYQLAKSKTIWECSSCRDCDLPALNSVNAVDVFHFDFQQTYPPPSSVLVNNFICDFYGLTFLEFILLLLR